MIKEHDQQAKMKATPRKLAYADSDKEAPAKSLARGFSDRFSLESLGTSNTHKQTRSASTSQRTPSKNNEPTNLRKSRWMEELSITKEKARRERFEEPSQKFLEEFSQQKRYAKDPTEIHGIKRRQSKGLQAFMDQFKSESSHIKGVPPILCISAFMHGYGHPELAKKLNEKNTLDSGRNVRKIKKQIEEAVGSEKLAHLVKDICQPNQRNRSQGRNNAKKPKCQRLVKTQKMRSSDGRFFGRNISSPESNRSLSNYGKRRKKQNGAKGPPAAATWQHPIGQPPVTWHLRQHGHRRQSTTVNAVGQRRSSPPATGQRRWITVVIGGQRWRSTTVAGGKPPLTAARPPLTTTEPPVNGGWWAGQRLEIGRSGSGLGRVWIGSGPEM
nr:reverse transcriptase domain-containing protein [Tanacetum cinerariifolium]